MVRWCGGLVVPQSWLQGSVCVGPWDRTGLTGPGLEERGAESDIPTERSDPPIPIIHGLHRGSSMARGSLDDDCTFSYIPGRSTCKPTSSDGTSHGIGPWPWPSRRRRVSEIIVVAPHRFSSVFLRSEHARQMRAAPIMSSPTLDSPRVLGPKPETAITPVYFHTWFAPQ